MSLRRDLENRFGLPFVELMQRFADMDFSRSDTAAVLNVPLANLQKTLQRHGDPFPAQSMSVRYRQETGGSLLASACYLAQTKTRSATARELGVSEGGLRHAVKLTFYRRERREWRQHRGTGQPRRISPTWQTYEAFGVKGSLRELTERFGQVPLATVRRRVHQRGWPLERALELTIEEAAERGRQAAVDRWARIRNESRLTRPTKAAAIRELARKGMAPGEIAERIGCSRSYATRIAYHGY